MRRQEILTRPSPPRLWVVMDETVLRWPVGGAEVMRQQVDHLIEVGRLPHVTLQIMPFAAGPHPAMRAGAFDLFRFRAPELPDIVYLGGLVGAVYLDKGDDVVVYREALDRLGACRMVVHLARAHLVYGEWLRRQNRRVDARKQLRIAHEMLDQIGAEAFAERARGELLATGETVRKRTADSRDALTAQEALVARLAAQGRTNPEIGAQLFISSRTAEYHLRKVFTKLGISSRRSLRDALGDTTHTASLI
jgi:DNA-binding CsgD family transcriptional regulator